jgi:RHS repeat-associated protein
MKSKLSFLLGVSCLLVSFSTHARNGSNLPQGQLNINLKEVNGLQDKFFEKKLISKPEYTTNTYVGNFQTAFGITLPQNEFLPDGLWFDYNSNVTQNVGYGIGFELRIPKLSFVDGKILFRSKSSNELVEVSNSAPISKRLQLLSNILGKNLNVKKAYRLKDEEDFSLFLNTQDGYLQLLPSGTSYLYNQDGQLVKIILINQKILELSYFDNRLVEMKSQTDKWEVQLGFKENEAQVKYVDGKFVQVPRGLNLISVKQGKTVRSYRFQYRDDLLVSVKKDGALLDIFKTDYKIQSGKISQTPFNGKDSENKNIVFQNFDKKAELVSAPSSDDKQIIQVDINGDFVTDEVTFESVPGQAEKVKMFQKFFSGVKERQCDERCSTYTDPAKLRTAITDYQNYLNSSKYNLKVRIGKFSNKAYELEADASLNMSIDMNSIGTFRVTGNDPDKLSVQFDQVYSPRFMDLNNDGKKDLVLCSNDEEKTFVENNQKQDLLVQSVFNLFNKPLADNIFKYNGKKPVVYLLKTNEKKVEELAVDNKSDIYHIPGVSYWEKKTAEFNCHSQSMMLDFNGDGINDLLTGKTVYLLGANLEVQPQALTDEELKNLFNISDITEESLTKARYGLIDVKGNGVMEAYQANNYYIQPTDRTIHILSDDKDTVLERPSNVALLTSMESSFGGKVKVDYQYVEGAYVVKRIVHNVGSIDQNDWEESFAYEGSRWHVQKNIFLGFKKSVVTKKITSNKTKKVSGLVDQKVLEFDLDNQNGPVFYFQRARKAGRVVNEKVVSNGQIEKEINNHFTDHMFSNGRSYSYIASQTINERGSLSLQTSNELDNFEFDIPLVFKESKKSGNQSSSTLTESTLSEMYLVRETMNTVTNQKGEKRTTEQNLWDELGRLKSRVTPAIQENFFYDSYGRVVSYKASNGASHAYTYKEASSLVESVMMNDLKTSYDYTDVENFYDQVTTAGSSDVFYLRYTTDGILTNVLRGDQPIFQVKMGNGKVVESTILDEKFKLQLDGFGRIASKTKMGEGDNLIQFKKSMDDQGRPLVEFSPFFEESNQPGHIVERKYDGLGNVVQEVVTDDLGNRLSEFNLSKGLCSEKLTEIGFKEVYCKNGFGDSVSSSIPNEASAFDYGFNGEIVAINPFQHSYKRNKNGDITDSVSKDWGTFSRVFDYSKNSVSYEDGVMELKTPYGEFKGYSNGLNTDSSVFMEAAYSKQLLSTLTVQAGSRKYLQTYEYNDSRVLVNKTEFNTSWAFKLDSFDRVSEEVIKDAKNSYELNYVRTSGVLTEIAPYIKNIVYSPMMKPILVEYSNGASVEYVYGPRGELVSSSLTNGMNVLYNAVNEYRSDLKLVSQSILVNGKLQREVFNYSYDNQFELTSKTNVKSALRDSRGQVTTLGGLEFGYHHLNLIKINTAGQSITNYYGENNHFFGSCDNSKNCFFKLSPNEVELNGELQKLIEVSGVPVGVLYKGNFYPAIIDHRMGVIGLLNTDGNAIKFLRHQDAWGNLESVTGDRAFEKQIAFGYARLMQNPLVEQVTKTKLYFSGTRVYSPAMGEWMSPDSTVVWNPEKLVNNPGNWDPFKYANNDSLNFLDEDGRFAHIIIAIGIGGLGGAISSAAVGENILNGALVGGVTGLAFISGAGLVASVTSVVAEASVVGIFTFSGNLLGQAIVTKSVNMVDAASAAILSPLALGYNKLFYSLSNGLTDILAREFASGLSFMSVDLSFSLISRDLARKYSNRLKMSENAKPMYNNLKAEDYTFKTIYGH